MKLIASLVLLEEVICFSKQQRKDKDGCISHPQIPVCRPCILFAPARYIVYCKQI